MNKNQPTETTEDFFALGVDNEMFNEALASGEITISIPLDEDSYTQIVENFEGSLLLNCDAPDTFHGIYFWNHGEFPYVIKKNLKRILLVNEGRAVPMFIKNIVASVGRRFRFDHKNRRTVADPNGDSCIWDLSFTLHRVAGETEADKPNTFLLRWNPSISSFKLEDYKSLINRFPMGFRLNWSIYQWEDAHDGNRFYMMRVGDEQAGIMFRGQFTSDPYPGNDWAGKGKTRYYADMDCKECSAPDAPRIPLARLMEAIPEVEWTHGHSGVLLTDEQAYRLNSLWKSMA